MVGDLVVSSLAQQFSAESSKTRVAWRYPGGKQYPSDWPMKEVFHGLRLLIDLVGNSI